MAGKPQDGSQGLVVRQVLVVTVGFLLVFAILAFAARIGLRSMEESYQRLDALVTQNNAKIALMTAMRDAIRERMVLTYDIAHAEDPFEADELAMESAEWAREFLRARERLLTLDLTDEQRARIERQREALGQAQDIVLEVAERARTGSLDGAGARVRQARLANERVLQELQTMRENQRELARQELSRADAAYAASRADIFVLGASALLVSVLVVAFTVWRILTQGHALSRANFALEEANTHLEQRVEARTRELMETRAENMRMGAELEVSQRLQRMLLPGSEELSAIDGLDIAAFMEPAAEVGGDYYDVLPRSDGLRIGIGDVTGHGLESGVVMLMTQSAVRTLTAADGTDVHATWSAINRALYGNVQRMASDKHMTLALLDYRPPAVAGEAARLRVSGQHESLLLLRADGTLEVLDTDELGFPVGLVEDIAPFVAEAEIELRPGDTLVLYTDGITEAADADDSLYGFERLCTLLRGQLGLDAAGIRNAVVADVRAHVGDRPLCDDLTLVVLKQG